MITYEGRTDFWIRHDRQKGRMSLAEVKAAVTSNEDLSMRAERFIERRRANIMAHGIGLMGTPLTREEGRVDIADPGVAEVLAGPPRVAALAPLREGKEPIRYSLRGRGIRSPNETLEVYRSGHVELLRPCPAATFEHRVSRLGGKKVAGYLINLAPLPKVSR